MQNFNTFHSINEHYTSAFIWESMNDFKWMSVRFGCMVYIYTYILYPIWGNNVPKIVLKTTIAWKLSFPICNIVVWKTGLRWWNCICVPERTLDGWGEDENHFHMGIFIVTIYVQTFLLLKWFSNGQKLLTKNFNAFCQKQKTKMKNKKKKLENFDDVSKLLFIVIKYKPFSDSQ